ncbi:hypothetical protein PoB_004245800 [Plakobranchus ocellatus]|uniref:AAA+ ATPase domain-containing protein n=1 Tax=Plakobranchus ocellatus TaxID=259542 RepID=A0AAV4B8N7_9GAST|nr:hypothetical protein PoB_004245800 [Plakobranchus ocellatus]
MGFGQKYPPALRRPYRETVPPTPATSQKGEPVGHRRPKLNYSAYPDTETSSFYPYYDQPSQIIQSGNFAKLPESWEYYQDSASYPSPQTYIVNDGTQWSIPAHVPVDSTRNFSQEHFDPSCGYAQYFGPVAMSQPYNNFSSPLPATSSQQFYEASQPVQLMPSQGFPMDMPPQAFQSNTFFGSSHAIPESQKNAVSHEMMVTNPYLVHPPLNSVVKDHRHSHRVAASQDSHAASLNWLAQGPMPRSVGYAVNHQHYIYNQIHPEFKSELDRIASVAHKFVDEACPLLSTAAYCHPPVIRSRHPDKSSKQLLMGMESEQRVLGTFERFFASTQTPVFMLCHYPVTGFLMEHQKSQWYNSSSREFQDPPSTRETITLILLSQKFCVTALTVSIINSNSDLTYIHRGVAKAAGHAAKCSKAVHQWLVSLGLTPKVKEVLAFPNLRRSINLKLSKDKTLQKNLSHVSLLHLDDLCAPFEEEWSTPAHKRQFTEWMEKNILCHPSALSANDLRLLIGALLCPQLSCIESMKNVVHIDPIPEKPQYSEKEQTSAEDVGQLQLTIDGVTMGFDDFMEEYVSSYYPNVETTTYRVPPLHFNIQSFKKGSSYVQTATDFDVESLLLEDDSEMDYMPPGASYSWHAAPHQGQVINAYSDGEDSSSDPEETDEGQASHYYAIERVTLDSIPDFVPGLHEQSRPVQSGKRDTQGKNRAKLNLREKPVMGDWVTASPGWPSQGPSTVSPQTTGASVVRLTKNSKSRNTVREPTPKTVTSIFSSSSPNPSSQGYPSTQPQSAFPGAPLVNSGVHAYSGSKPPVRNALKSSEEIHAAVLKDTHVMSDVMPKDARADEGENRVISAMEILGQKFGPMFIICSFQYNNYLNKLREEMFSKGEAARPTRAFGQIMRAEHDCLIFHKDYGVLIICIKAIGDNFSDWNATQDQIVSSTAKILHKALKQLEREEAMIRHVTSDLHTSNKLTCHHLIALPNMKREQVDAALDSDFDLSEKIHVITKGRGTKSFLCLDELPAKNTRVWDPSEESVWKRLVDWWKGLQESLFSTENAIDIKVYRQIIGRYCGLLSTMEVWTPNNPRMEVRSMSEAVKLCARRFSQVVLLPTQLQVLMSEYKRMYLFGPPGSGKTMLLILKAREWLIRGHTVILINSRWESTNGYPYAYGILDRLKNMMLKDGVPRNQLVMMNIDTSRFHPSMLAGVLPSCCIIMDEVSPSTLNIIEHLCCLQVENIWCAGLFLDDRPHTAQRFRAFKMEKVLRCPPIVQSLLKHIEPDAKFGAPYKDVYLEPSQQSTFQSVKRTSQNVLSDSKVNPSKSIEVNSSCDPEIVSSEVVDSESKKENFSTARKGFKAAEGKEKEKLKYDAHSVNQRLQKLSLKALPSPRTHFKKVQVPTTYLTSHSFVSGLPTDGPRPHIIDHQKHNRTGPPLKCIDCGRELADFLLSMVKTETQPNAYVSTNTTSTTDQKRPRFDSRALYWSDILIATCGVPKHPVLLDTLLKCGIPLEIAVSSTLTRTIETSRDKEKLFVTTFDEVVGLERALIVFIPSSAEEGHLSGDEENDELKELKDLSLRLWIQRYCEEDRRALWFIASRSLSDLVLLLP